MGTTVSRSFEDVCNILNIPFSYCEESAIPSHYQFKTQASVEKLLPGWMPKYTLEDGLEEYRKSYES